MRSQKAELNAWIRKFRAEAKRDLTSDEIAQKLEEAGWPMPKPKTPHEILAKQVSDAQSEETIYDEVLGEHIGRNICYQDEIGGKIYTLWGELDTATRKKAEKHKTLLRDQSVGDVYHATLKCMRWSRLHPEQPELKFEADFTPDIEWRLAAKQTKSKGAGA
jgi:hypothetical protein